MLSEEEMKAIEDLKDMIEKSKDLMEEEFYKLATIHNIQAVATILNLIEKQSKEIEHQIEKRANQRQELAILNAKQIEFNKLVNTVNSYKGQFKRQQKEIEEYKKQLDLDNECEIALNSKVMDLEKEIEELKDKYSDEKIRNTIIKRYREVIEKDYVSKDLIREKIEDLKKQDKEDRLSHNYLIIPVLQSLLEKE